MESDDKLFSRIVRGMLVLDHTKGLVRKSDLRRLVHADMSSADFTCAFDRACSYLERVFGFQLKSAGDERPDQFYLVNTIKNINKQYVNYQEILLVTVLAIIWMSDGACSEEKLFSALDELKIPKNELTDDPANLIKNQFIKLNYIDKKKVGLEDTSSWEYVWGRRSKTEIEPKDIVNFVSEIYGIDPSNWGTILD